MSSISSDISSHCPSELDEDSYGPCLIIPRDTKKHGPRVDPKVGVFKRKGKKGNETNDQAGAPIKEVEEKEGEEEQEGKFKLTSESENESDEKESSSEGRACYLEEGENNGDYYRTGDPYHSTTRRAARKRAAMLKEKDMKKLRSDVIFYFLCYLN